MQGRIDGAIAKYREAITRPPTADSHDRARLDAYTRLLALLEQRKDIDGVEALHRQRVADYGATSCHGAEFARFLLRQRGDAAGAIELARKAQLAPCAVDLAREVLGLAHYLQWSTAEPPQRDELLNQARVFLPAGPRLLYQLATSDRTLPAARALLGQGESIEQRDNERLTALALALGARDHAAARRLLRLGARADTLVGLGDIAVALGPVISMDFEGIRLMQQFGVDYAKLHYRGETVLEHARRAGDRRLTDALDPKTRSL